jgi:predicted GIY-YIG superfamily endonuclease
MYVYILQSLKAPSRFYVGLTDDPDRRLKEHNWGESRHTNRFRPWQSVVTFWFAEDKTARRFERYLKSGSGREFVKRHFQSSSAPRLMAADEADEARYNRPITKGEP